MELKILLWVHIVGELPSDATPSAPPCAPLYAVRVCTYIIRRRHAESPFLDLATVPVVIDGMRAFRVPSIRVSCRYATSFRCLTFIAPTSYGIDLSLRPFLSSEAIAAPDGYQPTWIVRAESRSTPSESETDHFRVTGARACNCKIRK